MLGSRARQREQRQQRQRYPNHLHKHTHSHSRFVRQRIERMIDNRNNTDTTLTTTMSTSTSPPHAHPMSAASLQNTTKNSQDDFKAEPDARISSTTSQLKRSHFSTTYLRRVLATLYSPAASYIATAIHNSVPQPPYDPTEPPLSPRSAALASAVAYPFPAAPAVYSVPFIINDQICIVPYVPLPRPTGYTTTTKTRSSTLPSITTTATTATITSPLSPTRSPLQPPSPPPPSLHSLLPATALTLGQQWLTVLQPTTLSAHFHPNLYCKLLHSPTAYQSHITKDITRTFPTHPLFQQAKTRTILYNILAAYSNYDIDIGYSQGMGFLVGFLLLHCINQTESDMFWSFINLMYSQQYSLRSLYFDDCISIKKLLILTQHCLDTRSELKRLAVQLRGLELDVTLFVTQWYVTVYSYRFDIEFSESVWNEFIMGNASSGSSGSSSGSGSGWRVLLCVALSVMEWLQERVVGLGFEGVMSEVRGMEGVGVEVVQRSRAMVLSAEVEAELEACKQSEKRVRSLKVW